MPSETRRVVRRPVRKPVEFDVPVAEAQEDVDITLRGEKGSVRPYCTCGSTGGYTFDSQMGIYVHGPCHKPSKKYYEAAVAAGVIRRGNAT